MDVEAYGGQFGAHHSHSVRVIFVHEVALICKVPDKKMFYCQVPAHLREIGLFGDGIKARRYDIRASIVQVRGCLVGWLGLHHHIGDGHAMLSCAVGCVFFSLKPPSSAATWIR